MEKVDIFKMTCKKEEMSKERPFGKWNDALKRAFGLDKAEEECLKKQTRMTTKQKEKQEGK